MMKVSTTFSCVFIFLFVGVWQPPSVKCEKILFLSFFSSKSHKIVYESLLTELANRGHLLTIVTPVKGAAHKNIKEIIGIGAEDLKGVKDVISMRINKDRIDPSHMAVMVEHACRSYYNMSEVLNLKNENFDLVIVSAFMNECVFGLLPHIKAPFIFITTTTPFQWTAAITGTPSPNSFVPVLFFGYDHTMTFLQRVANLLGRMAIQAYFDFVMLPNFETLYREYLGEDTPSIHEIQKNVSLILSNSHLTLSHPRPLMPDIVEVGGMSCRDPKPLPKDLDDYLNDAGKEGFIYFSMGSVVKAHQMPESYRKLFVSAFSKLKQRVIWKWETETMEDLPKNVKLSKWFPQQDVLGHPNIKIFITHGGLGSTVESVYHGVPLVGIPMFGDQDTNMKQSESNGFAVTLEFADLTEELLLKAIRTILENPKYSQRAKQLSTVYRDRPQKPLASAVYWTEYVIKYKGAPHLRSPARDLNWVQYHSLDVITFIFGVILTVMYVAFLILRSIFRKLCGTRRKAPTKKKSS